MIDEANDFLMNTGVPSAKFPAPGTTVRGRITQRPEVQQQRDFDSGELLVWDDGSPRKQIKIVLATDDHDPEVPDDDGTRAVYVKGYMLKAVQSAMRKAKAKLEVGGELEITYTQDGEVKKRGMNPPKLYSAVYTPAAEASVEDALAEADREAPAAPAAPAQPAPATQSAPAMPDLSQMTPEQIQALLNAAQKQNA